MTLRSESRAERELSDALHYYRRVGGAALAADFLADVDDALAKVAADPTSHASHPAAADPAVRRCPVGSRWPYDVLFKALPAEVLIVHLWHHSRDPAGIDHAPLLPAPPATETR